MTLHVLRGRAIERLGCSGHAGLPSRQTALVRGLPVTSLADTCVDLGELAEPALTRDDLVVIGDAIALALDRALAPVDEDDDAAWADYVAARYDAEQATWSVVPRSGWTPSPQSSRRCGRLVTGGCGRAAPSFSTPPSSACDLASAHRKRPGRA